MIKKLIVLLRRNCLMQAINKHESNKLKLGVASAALCATFLLTTNANQTVKADTITGKQAQISSVNKPATSQAVTDDTVQHPDISVQVVGNDTDNATNSDNTAPVSNATNDKLPKHTETNISDQVPTIIKSDGNKLINKAKTSLQGKTVNTQDNSWNDAQTDYDDVNHALTIKGGALTNPNPIYQQFANKVNDLQTIKITGKVNLSGSAKGLFSNLTNLKTIEGLENVDVTNVTDMSYLFNSDTNLTRLDLSYWAPKNTTDMNHMFSNCSSLERIYIKISPFAERYPGNIFDTSKVTNMSAMFQNDKELAFFGSINENDLPMGTEGDTSAEDAIKNKHAYADLEHLDTNKVTDMSYMFQGCDSLYGIGLSNNMPSIENMSHFASDCKRLKEAGSVGAITLGKVTDWSYMLANDPELCVADFLGDSGDEKNETSATASHMFYNDPKLDEVIFSGFGNLTDTSYMFANDTTLDGYLSDFMTNYLSKDNHLSEDNTTKLTNMSHMLENCSSLTNLYLVNFSTNDNLQADRTDMLKGLTSLSTISLGKDVNLEGTGFMPPFDYTAVGTGTDTNPKGKTYTATGLRKFWNNQTGSETFIGKPVNYYNVVVNFVDTKSGKVLKSIAKYGNSEDPLEFKDDFDQTIKALTQDGSYTYDAKNNTVPLDKNGDIQLPASVKSDVAYTVGLTPKAAPVAPTPAPVPKPHVDTPTDTIITNVVVHYQDEFGNKLQADKTITGKLGGSWNAVPEEINGYHLVATKGMATGTISDVRQEVTFVYTKDQPAKPVAPNKSTNKPTKPQPKPAKPNKKPSKSNKPNKQPKPAVIDHGTTYLPSTNNKSKSSFTKPTIVKAAYANSTNKGHTLSTADSNLPQTGINAQSDLSSLITGITALLISALSYLGFTVKKKHN